MKAIASFHLHLHLGLLCGLFQDKKKKLCRHLSIFYKPTTFPKPAASLSSSPKIYIINSIHFEDSHYEIHLILSASHFLLLSSTHFPRPLNLYSHLGIKRPSFILKTRVWGKTFYNYDFNCKAIIFLVE
jgi:hypothetical protein